MNLSRRAFATGSLTLGAAVMAGLPAFAQSTLTAADRETVGRVSSWFQGVRAARGNFVETGPGGRRAEGRYFIQRPGKMRFEYSNPEGLLVVADGNNLMRYDPRLEVFRQAPCPPPPCRCFWAATSASRRACASTASPAWTPGPSPWSPATPAVPTRVR
ncbi:LolA family protein [Brevundimonas denitrificans]|uniref:LolA family protein n=1 Tax=Brevundimonas denitrificans TaxID=1443434 RepID=UPI00223C33AE|nr:outer membrane lipoprotein carrier protein LolA [Brevundimonas denitrificans]